MHALFFSRFVFSPFFAGGSVARFSIGDRVSQVTYGTGTVTAVNEYHTTIAFDAHGPRTFATALVRLDPSDTVAPPKPVRRTRKAAVRVATA
jgi:hypothetical protein